jgi:ArsR family transcriptional regulator, arsenate/arsenite/antimonite-responsive transcriptional repressor / arsenate reductase (thioredoxin)
MNIELLPSPAVHLEARAQVHAALADPHRLRIVDLLAISDRSPAELGRDLGIGSSLLAHHIATLEAAELVERRVSAGDRRRRYLRLVPRALTATPDTPDVAADMLLFVCTANSARSPLAAALWNRGSSIRAESAGTHPASAVHPLAVRTARRAGLDLERARPRTLADVGRRPDLVVAVCDRAYEELSIDDVPAVHWSIADPAERDDLPAFEAALASLDERIEILRPLVRPRNHTPGRSLRERHA